MMTPMKIILFDYLFEHNRPGITGLSDHVWDWAKHLVPLGDEVHIVAPYPDNVHPPEGAIVHRFPLPPIGYRNVAGHLLIILRGWQEIQKIGRAHLIHAPEYLSTGVFTMLNKINNKPTPVVLTAPGNVYERIANGNPFDPMHTQALKVAAISSATMCNQIIAISTDQKEWWAKTGAHPDKITVLPHGINTATFTPQADARQQLGFDPEAQILFFVGRLSPEKGVIFLLQALSRLIATNPSVQLHIAGDGRQKDELVKKADELNLHDYVHWHGWLAPSQLPLLYSAADVCVVPSLSEPMGRVVLEAMACACVVLGTRVGGIKDLIQDNYTGYLCEPSNANDLHDKLYTMLNNPQQANHVAQQALTFVREEQSLERHAQRMRTTVYSKLEQEA